MRLLSLSLVAGILISTARPASTTTTELTGFHPCDALIAAGLSSRLLHPTDAAYEPRIQSYWALNTRQHPYCIFQPHTAGEVSIAVSTLFAENSTGAGDWHLAIRAGGHNLRYANNIDNGVTIDLLYLNQTRYDKQTNVASLGPGSKWQDVYAELHKYGAIATGGRDGDVGVGGFLLGGGSTYYMASQGFACDSIVNYEVVLVNGSIANANKHENADLWKALKGGGSNFGIVTRFDLEALPDTKIARGERAISAQYTGQFMDAIVGFTEQQQRGDADALVAILMHTEGEDVLATIEVNTEGVENSTAFKSFNQLPQITPFNQSVEYLYEAALDSRLDGGAWVAQTTLTFKNDKRMLNHAAAIHSKFASSLEILIGKESFTSLIFFQPLPSLYADISADKGGNLFAHTLDAGNAILWTGGVVVNTNETDLMVASAKMHEMVAELEEYSQKTGNDNPLVYMNYADFSQDPLGSYGEESVDFMKRVARKYDPQGRFQKMVPGGFKIARVHN
ncbi:hypothetical protein BDV18DRAFT_154258 [Aspergillus unguis]